MKHSAYICVFTLTIMGLLLSPVQADTVEDILKSAIDNYKSQKYNKALEDLDWAKREIGNMQIAILKKLLPESLPGYETQPIEGGAMLGMQNVSRTYIKGEQSIEISISGGQAGQAGGLGALMGMAAAFQSMDAGIQSETLIIKGNRGQWNLETESNHGTLTINLDSKVVITVESSGFTKSDAAKGAAEALDYDAIMEALK